MRATLLVLAAALVAAVAAAAAGDETAAMRQVVQDIRFRSKAEPVKDQEELTSKARDANRRNGDNKAFPDGAAEAPHPSLVRVPGESIDCQSLPRSLRFHSRQGGLKFGPERPAYCLHVPCSPARSLS